MFFQKKKNMRNGAYLRRSPHMFCTYLSHYNKIMEPVKPSWLYNTGVGALNLGYKTGVGALNLGYNTGAAAVKGVKWVNTKRHSRNKRQSLKKKADAAEYCRTADCPSLYQSQVYATVQTDVEKILDNLQTVVVPHLKKLVETVKADGVRYQVRGGTRLRRVRRIR